MAILIVISSDQEWVVARDRFKNVTVERSPYGEWFNTSISAIETPLIFFHGRWGKIVGDEGSEAYGNVAHFEEGSRIVLNELFDHLSEWLERAGIS